MANVNITIDGRQLSVPAGMTILAAAKANDIYIPTLCFLEKLDPHASCRMCVVEVEGARTFQHACAAKVREGMVVRTNTEAVRKSRKLTLQLLLSDHSVDCHHCLRIGSSRCTDLDPKFCEWCFLCDCVKDGFCDLQRLAREYEVDQLPFEQKHNTLPIDESSVIVRNPNKCVKCRRCVDVCGNVQTVHNLAASGRGSEVVIGPAFGKPMAESRCVGCGLCVDVCPTGAIYAAEHKDELVYFAHKDGVKTVAQVDAALIPELEKVWKCESGTVTVEQVAGALKKIGVDHVVSSECAARAAQAKAEALLDERLSEKKPLILSNDPAAWKFLRANFPEQSDRFAFYPSELELFGRAARQEFGADRVFAFTPIGISAVETAESVDLDIAVNSRELYRIMVRTGSEPNPRRVSTPERFDVPETSGKYGDLLLPMTRNLEPDYETVSVKAGRKNLRCALCRNLGQARRAIEAGGFDVIRVIS